MNRLIPLLCIAFGALSSCHAATPRASKAPTNDAAIRRYFVANLTGDKEALPAKALSLDAVAKARTQVWHLWAEANKSVKQETLPVLSPLTKGASSHSWRLTPEEYNGAKFEAIMPFFFGTKGSKPADGYPLYLDLHGSGPKEQEWPITLEWALTFDDAPSVYFIPQIPNGGETADGQLYRWWQKSKLEAWEQLLRQAFLSGEINPKRIYFLGVSEGGYGSQRLASYYPDYLAAAGPMAGGEPLINAPAENLQHVAFSLRTGANDKQFHRNELTEYTRDALNSLANKYPGYYKHFIDIIPKYGHGIPYQFTTPYLKQHVRTAQPRSVHWEDFPVDGCYRKGCYNLAPLERPEGKDRIYYEEEIKGNTIDLKVSSVKYVEKKVSDWYKDFKLVLLYDKVYEPVTKGKLRIYLSPELLDLRQPVTIRINGREVYSGLVKADYSHLVESCVRFFDPERLFPAAVDVAY